MAVPPGADGNFNFPMSNVNDWACHTPSAPRELSQLLVIKKYFVDLRKQRVIYLITVAIEYRRSGFIYIVGG